MQKEKNAFYLKTGLPSLQAGLSGRSQFAVCCLLFVGVYFLFSRFCIATFAVDAVQLLLYYIYPMHYAFVVFVIVVVVINLFTSVAETPFTKSAQNVIVNARTAATTGENNNNRCKQCTTNGIANGSNGALFHIKRRQADSGRWG